MYEFLFFFCSHDDNDVDVMLDVLFCGNGESACSDTFFVYESVVWNRSDMP